jgi:hypothetical protein
MAAGVSFVTQPTGRKNFPLRPVLRLYWFPHTPKGDVMAEKDQPRTEDQQEPEETKRRLHSDEDEGPDVEGHMRRGVAKAKGRRRSEAEKG